MIASMLLAVIGAAWGAVADRIAARWPAHDDGHVRPVDWRTAVTMVLGGAALGVLPARFADPAQVLLFGAYFAAFTLLLATDLDQRLLPNRITWPMMLVSLALAVTGLNPLVEGHLLSAVVAAIVIPGLLFAVSIPFGAGALGLGDVWLLISVGLLGGLLRAGAGVFVGVMLAGVVLLALLALRRITLRTYVPFGPFLIIGAYWAILVTL